MKIRILGNSVRYRLTRSEVDQLCSNGKVEERTFFGDSVFIYSVQLSSAYDHLTAVFIDNQMTFYLPQSIGKNWSEIDRVGFDNEIEVGEGDSLYLLLEKDYACLEPRHEDESDQYPNPKAINKSNDY